MSIKLEYKDTDITEARSSKIHEMGLYLTKPIPWGTRFIEYKGKHVTGKEMAEAEKDARADYLFEVSDTECIDGYKHGSIARFANHSCDPTCFILREDKRIFFVTKDDMNHGDEVTIDYNIQDKSLKCNCGSKKCKGFM